MKWEMVPKRYRDDVISALNASARGNSLGPFGAPWREAYEAAAALLWEAVPYPDEALVVSVDFNAEHRDWDDEEEDPREVWPACEIVDVDDLRGEVKVRRLDNGYHRLAWMRHCTPLTPGAADLLSELGGGE